MKIKNNYKVYLGVTVGSSVADCDLINRIQTRNIKVNETGPILFTQRRMTITLINGENCITVDFFFFWGCVSLGDY